MQLQPVFYCSSLSTLDPGSGREIQAIYHGTGVWTVLLPQNLNLELGMGRFQGFCTAVAFSAWVTLAQPMSCVPGCDTELVSNGYNYGNYWHTF